LDRTLDIITIPSLLLCGGFLSNLMKKNIVTKYIVLVAIFILVATSLWTSIPYATFRKDAMQDIKELSLFLEKQELKTIYADEELFLWAAFYITQNVSNKMKWVSWESLRSASGEIPWERLEKGSLVVLGGSRRPDVYFKMLSQFYPYSVPAHWRLVKEFKRELKPWREKQLKVYLVT
jgi:hypothetical protein